MHTNSDEKVFYMKNHLLEILVKHFQNPQKPNRKKDTGLLRSGEAKKFRKFQIVVKLWSNNGQTNYSRILVLLNNYFSFFEFWSNLVKLWSNNGQTNYSRNISVTK